MAQITLKSVATALDMFAEYNKAHSNTCWLILCPFKLKETWVQEIHYTLKNVKVCFSHNN